MNRFRQGVLFADYEDSTHYRLLFEDDRDRLVANDILQEDTNTNMLIGLYKAMRERFINAVAVMPDTLLAKTCNRVDMEAVEGKDSMYAFVPGSTEKPTTSLAKQHNDFPAGLKLYRMGDVQRFIQFPDRIVDNGNGKHWQLPLPTTLLNTLLYIRDILGVPLSYSVSGLGISVVRQQLKYYKKPSVELKPFPELLGDNRALWVDASKHMADRVYWHSYKRTGTDLWDLGLSEAASECDYIYAFDKNAQYLGSMTWVPVGQGMFHKTGKPRDFKMYPCAFWEVTLKSVRNTEFNGYEMPCPLPRRTSWVSSALLKFCEDVGVEFEIHKGIVWEEYLKETFRGYAEFMWQSRKALKDERQYKDRIAAKNADMTFKQSYTSLLGRFNAPYSKELYQPHVHKMIIHQSVALQGYTLRSKLSCHGIKPVMVSNDAIYVASSETDLAKVYPGILDHCNELRGYKFKGRVPLTPSLVYAFNQRSSANIEKMIAEEIEHA